MEEKIYMFRVRLLGDQISIGKRDKKTEIQHHLFSGHGLSSLPANISEQDL
jgi:hypothetical protein